MFIATYTRRTILDKLSYSTIIGVKKSNDHYEAIYPRASIAMVVICSKYRLIYSSINRDWPMVVQMHKMIHQICSLAWRLKLFKQHAHATFCDLIDRTSFCFWKTNGFVVTKLSDFKKFFHWTFSCYYVTWNLVAWSWMFWTWFVP